MKLHRRLFVVMLIIVLSLAVLAVPSQGKAKYVLKAGLLSAPDHVITLAMNRVADLVDKRTNGEVKVEVYPSGQLGNAMDTLQGLRVGTVEMFVEGVTWLGAFETDYWIPGVLYVFNDQEQCREMHRGASFNKMAETMRTKHGIRVLTQDWDRGPRHFISTKPIRTVDDLKGLKIRVPEQKSWIANFRLAGANPTPIAFTETFTGLQMGVIQAAEQALNWLYFNKYHTVAKNVTLSYHNYEETGVFISEKVYQTLPANYQKILTDAVREVSAWHNDYVAKDIENAKKAMEKEGATFIEPDLKAFRNHWRAVIPQLAKEVGYSQDLVNDLMSKWK